MSGESFTAESVIEIVKEYSQASGSNKAAVKLQEFQKSVESWQICDQLLRLCPQKDVAIIAAQTLKTKIQINFKELPISSHEALMQSLSSHLVSVKEQDSISQAASKQLCLALVDLIYQMPHFQSPVSSFINKFNSQSCGDTNAKSRMDVVLLDSLRYLPEEIDNKTLGLGENRRNAIRNALSNDAPLVIRFLDEFLNNAIKETPSRTEIFIKVFKCLGSWFSSELVPLEAFISCNIFTHAFSLLNQTDLDIDLQDSICDTLCSVAYICENIARYEQLGNLLFENVILLQAAYHKEVAHENFDHVLNLTRVFTETAEAFLLQTVQCKSEGLGRPVIINILLDCCGHFDFEVADITLNYWFRLSEQIGKDVALLAYFKPYFERLLVALCRLCTYSDDEQDSSADYFLEFRSRARELLQDCVYIIGAENVFNYLHGMLDELSASEQQWRQLEAVLFVLSSVAQGINIQENIVTPQVLAKSLSLPNNTNRHVKQTTVILIGELAEWISAHPDVLQPVLQYLAARLQESSLNEDCAAALMHICINNSSTLVSHFDTLVELLRYMNLKDNQSAVNFLRGLSTILSQQPPESFNAQMQKLCSLIAAPMEPLLSNPKENTNLLVHIFDRIATVLCYTRPPFKPSGDQTHPCLPAILQLWPLLSAALDAVKDSNLLTERCSRCIRYAMRSLGKDFVGLIDPLVVQMVRLYAINRASCFLYLGSILVDEFGEEKAYSNGISSMFTHFTQQAIALFNTKNGYVDNPDTVDDYFRLCNRVVQHCPLVLFSSDCVDPVMNSLIVAVSIQHREAHASVSTLLSNIFGFNRNNEEVWNHIHKLFLTYGEHIVEHCICAAIFRLPHYLFKHIDDILVALSKFDLNSFCMLVAATFQKLAEREETINLNITKDQLSECYNNFVKSAEKQRFIEQLKILYNLYR